jgi:hypothetical protein
MEPADTAVKMIAIDGAAIAHLTIRRHSQAAAEASVRVQYPDKVDHKTLLARRPLTLSCLAKTAQ